MGSTSTQLHVGASLSSGSSSGKFDVFLSFAGSDTRKGFVDHLFTALLQKGIVVFKDDVTLERGEYIRDALPKAIEESRFAIVIFSEKYASSKWCLLELVKILECKKTRGLTVFPVFYKVDPSDLRKQTGSVREAFARHEQDSSEEVQSWRNALLEAASISGWDSENGTTHGSGSCPNPLKATQQRQLLEREGDAAARGERKTAVAGEGEADAKARGIRRLMEKATRRRRKGSGGC